MIVKKNLKRMALAMLAAIPLAQPMQAKITLPRFFSDGMVLQQQSRVPLWGSSTKKNQRVSVTTSWNRKAYTTVSDAEGRFRVEIETPQWGGPYTLTLSDGDRLTLSDVMVGEVWLCSGQSNMDMRMSGRYGDGVYGALDAIVTSTNPAIRMFNVELKMTGEPLDDVGGEWQSASPATTPEFSAAAYFFARRLNDALHVPVGIVHASCGGSKVEAWMSAESVAPYKDSPEVQNASILYNGMLHALIGYGIRGCLWYQGEANVESPDLYTQLFPTMVADWRTRWGQGEFPFIYAQIAPYNYNHKGGGKAANSAFLREAQVKCLKLIPNSGMIVLSDVGQPQTIHPMDKQTVGNRFATMALGLAYGQTGFPLTGPLFREMTVEGDKATLSFDNIGKGLTTYRRPLTGFEVAGADSVFHPAHVRYGKDMQTLIVSSPDVPSPVAVRYGFKDYFDGCLYNMLGQPASSFRTDDWEPRAAGDVHEPSYAKEVVDLWPDGAPDSNGKDGQRPTLTVYHPQKPSGKAIIMCPGGGYGHLALTHEGHDMAEWMTSMGVTYCVLEYRLPYRHHTVPLNDAERALAIVRSHAGEWQVDANSVGIMGGSAGGHLAASLATLHSGKSTRPDFQILLYPVISMDADITNKGTHDNLIGPEAPSKLMKRYSLEQQVSKRTPKAFIALSADDSGVAPENSQRYKQALERKGVPVEMHVYPTGGHGWGFKDSFAYKRQWTEALRQWLERL